MSISSLRLSAVISLITILFISFSEASFAQGHPVACQDDERFGLDWKNGIWTPTSYFHGKFILVIENGTLTSNSVMKAFDSLEAHCTQNDFLKEQIICLTHLPGEQLVYNIKTQKGARSNIFGAMFDTQKKDSIYVSPFTCESF